MQYSSSRDIYHCKTYLPAETGSLAEWSSWNISRGKIRKWLDALVISWGYDGCGIFIGLKFCDLIQDWCSIVPLLRRDIGSLSAWYYRWSEEFLENESRRRFVVFIYLMNYWKRCCGTVFRIGLKSTYSNSFRPIPGITDHIRDSLTDSHFERHERKIYSYSYEYLQKLILRILKIFLKTFRRQSLLSILNIFLENIWCSFGKYFFPECVFFRNSWWYLCNNP